MPGLLRPGAALGQRPARDLLVNLLRSIGDALVAVAIAPRCAACARVLDHPLDGPVCATCWLSVPLGPHWIVAGGAIDAGRAVGAFEDPLRGIIHAFKYEGRRTIGARLGRLLHSAAQDLLADARCVVPVPLHPWRRFRRGFNQAADLARTLDRPLVHALWRTRATPPQTGLSASARRRNVRGAFRLSPLIGRRLLDSHVDGRVVVIVDDVWTTGATLEECARVLKAAGAKEVRALTIARATAGTLPGPS